MTNNNGVITEKLRVMSTGNVGIGTTTPSSRLALQIGGVTASGTAGFDRRYDFANAASGTVQFGELGYLRTTNTATTTIIGSMFRVEDSTAFGNTIRGLEVQTQRGTNTLGENTALSGFARTFGVRGTTEGDAGSIFEPAGVYGETRGTTQGNAIRAYSGSVTTASLMQLFQDTSAFSGTGLLMNFGNSTGSFSSTSSRFIDLKNAGTSKFTITAQGTTTIGDGTTNNMAGLQIGFGGLCVDNDGSCTASTSGRISSVSAVTGNSDLAEMYFSSESLKPGEIVYSQGNLSIGRASESTKATIIGVVSTKPGLLMGFDDSSLTIGESGYPIALSGRVPILLSDENGPISVGDELMISSLPGVAMKATSTGRIIGVALEDYDGQRAYSDTYINQFGDDIAQPVFTPLTSATDARINDGCYYGGGNATGEEACIPLKATTTDARVVEAAQIAARDARTAALRTLALVGAKRQVTDAGTSVRVGQIVMFVDLRYRYLDDDAKTMVANLLAVASTTSSIPGETIWSRLVTLANNFLDGVLTLTGLKADRIEADRVETQELCVGGVCVTPAQLQGLLDTAGQTKPQTSNPNPNPAPAPAPNSNPAPAPAPANQPTEAQPQAPTAPQPEPQPAPVPTVINQDVTTPTTTAEVLPVVIEESGAVTIDQTNAGLPALTSSGGN